MYKFKFDHRNVTQSHSASLYVCMYVCIYELADYVGKININSSLFMYKSRIAATRINGKVVVYIL